MGTSLRALKIHLLDWKCHYFPRGGRGLEVTTLSLCHFVTIGLGGVGVKANLDNVTKYEDFFLKASLSRCCDGTMEHLTYIL